MGSTVGQCYTRVYHGTEYSNGPSWGLTGVYVSGEAEEDARKTGSYEICVS